MHPKSQRHSGTETRERQSPTVLPPDSSCQWLKVGEAAAMLGCSRLTVYRLAKSGKLPSLKYPGLGVRVDREALRTMLERAASCPASR